LEGTGPVSRRRRLPVVIHRARRLLEADRAVVDAIPVTAVPRTTLDMAARVRPERLQRLLERLEELRLLDLPAFDDLLNRTAGHHGRGRLRRALALYRSPPFTRSGIERRFLELAATAGLPRAATGFNVAGHELDVYWPEFRFGVELDLFETHGTRASFEGDRVRDEDLLLEEVATIRVTGPRLEREPQQVVGRVRRLLQMRGWGPP
jgi:hypothetical protein